jgi:hypothetical protein
MDCIFDGARADAWPVGSATISITGVRPSDKKKMFSNLEYKFQI